MPPRRVKAPQLSQKKGHSDGQRAQGTKTDGPRRAKASRIDRRPFCIPGAFAPELWCSIWRLLSPQDRYAAMLVCRSWRKIALGDARLWTEPTLFTAVHAKGCACKRCSPRKRQGRTPEGWSAAPPALYNRSNSAAAADILDRSRHFDIEVTVDIMPYKSDTADTAALANALLLHKDRIVALTVRSADPAGCSLLMSHFTSLLKLRSFCAVLLTTSGDDYDAPATDFARRTLTFPALETLQLDKGYTWPPTPIKYDCLRFMSLTPIDDASVALSLALSSCPRLEKLRVDLRAYAYEGEQWYDPEEPAQDVRALASHLQSVEIAGIDDESEQWVLDALASPTLPSLSLEFKRFDIGMRGWSRFRGVRGSVRVSAALRTEWEAFPSIVDSVLAIEMVSDCGRSRQITLHSCRADRVGQAMRELASHLDPQATPTLAVDLAIWPAVAKAFSRFQRVRGLELLLSTDDMRVRYGDSPEDTSARGKDDGHSVTVGSLTLISGSTDSRATFRPNDVARLVKTLAISLPLDSLTIDARLRITGSRALSALANLADRVDVAHCRAPELVFPPPVDIDTDDGSFYQTESSEDSE